jgi:hypothetical protein
VITAPIPGVPYRIVSLINENFALTLKEGKAHSIVIDTFQSQDAQKFIFGLDHGKYVITCAAENRVLHVDGDSNQSGADIHAAHHKHNSNHFEIVPNKDGKSVNIKTSFGKALDIKGGVMASGTGICQWDSKEGANNQAWIIVPFDWKD